MQIEKWYPNRPLSCIYFNGDKEIFYVKRFLIETTSKKTLFIPESAKSELTIASTQYLPKVKIEFNKRLKETKDLEDKVENLNDLIDVKGMKAQGNQLTRLKVKEISLLPVVDGEEWPIEEPTEQEVVEISDDKLNKGTSEVIGSVNEDKSVEIDLDVNVKKNTESDGQINLF